MNRTKKKQRVHFLHIGKTGGTAVRHAIQQHEVDPKYEMYFPVVNTHDYLLRDVPEGEKVIFFLRDPVSRFVSGFYSRQRQGRPRYDKPWRENEKIVFERFSTANQMALALSSQKHQRIALGYFFGF